MLRQSVPSSNVASIGYDDATETLEVEFVSGSIYQYYNVPRNLFEELVSAASKEQFLNQYIKNTYPFSRVG